MIKKLIEKVKVYLYFRRGRKMHKELQKELAKKKLAPWDSTIEYYSGGLVYTRTITLNEYPDIDQALEFVEYKKNPDYVVFEKFMSEVKKVIYIHKSKIDKVIIT